MTDLTFTDAAIITGTRTTPDGYLHGDVRCARIGCQDYLGSEMGRPDLAIVTVYRPESTVFDKASLATFSGKPIAIGHPADGINAETWKEHAVGDLGDEIARDGEFVKVPYRLMDAAAIAAVGSGTREVSMGYSCGLEWGDGIAPDGTPYQATQVGPLRVNHLALVDTARGGHELRIGDAKDAGKDRAWGATPLIHHGKDTAMADTPQTRTVMVDGLPIPTTDAGAQALDKQAKVISDRDTTITKMTADHATAIADKDKTLAEKDAEIEKLKKAEMSDADLDKRVADRAALIGDAAKIAPDVKVAGLSDAAIRKAVVSAKLGDKMPADASEAYVDARFQIMSEDAAETQATDGIVSLVTTADGAAPVNLADMKAKADAARAAQIKGLADGHLNKKEA